MNALLLSGMSLRNRDWITEVASTLKPLFKTTLVQAYEHWATGRTMDLDIEEQSIKTKLPDLGNEYIIFAKSAGSVLGLRAIANGTLRPKKCIFCGVALGMAKKADLPIADWLAQANCPILFIQNNNDPAASFSDLKTFVQQHSKS